MAGHNKWSKIKHKKAASDAQKSRVFGRIAQVLTMESRKCGGDRGSPGLKAAIEQAKSANMAAKNIDRAIERGTGANAASLESVTYEAYGPGGCAILIETFTDNRNRTAAEIRHILIKNGCSIGAPGSASWIFKKERGTMKATSVVDLSADDAEKLEKVTSELEESDDVQEVHTNKK